MFPAACAFTCSECICAKGFFCAVFQKSQGISLHHWSTLASIVSRMDESAHTLDGCWSLSTPRRLMMETACAFEACGFWPSIGRYGWSTALHVVHVITASGWEERAVVCGKGTVESRIRVRTSQRTAHIFMTPRHEITRKRSGREVAGCTCVLHVSKTMKNTTRRRAGRECTERCARCEE